MPRLLSDRERLDWLRLIRSENVGPVTFDLLLQRFGSAAKAIEALPGLARQGGRQQALRVASEAAAREEMKAVARLGATLLAKGEPGYPPALAAIADAPPLICRLGLPVLDHRPAIAIVGARNASLNGRSFARKLAEDLGRAGVVVVSGLARGIDTAAHEGALASGTVAVVAGGVDVIYPEENTALYGRIVETGAVLAELPPGTVPQARHFPRRNRIISGLAQGVVVVEASPNSGSLITARFALDQGREVFAVPGSPLDPRARGANSLIKQGATLVEGADDILEAISRQRAAPLAEREADLFDTGRPADPDGPALATARRRLGELLGPSPVQVDELIRECQLSPAVVLTVLLELELAGRLERQAGNRVALTGADRAA
ncbi:MAG: DNA-processing protein DprA [Thalassobaculales bacterium]